MGKIKPQIFERGDKLYLVAPVSPFKPEEAQIEEFAFADQLRKGAPNPNFLWLKGNYVEADNPNANGDMWSAEEIAIKSLTPMYCPVTVMHDPRTAVGLIADTRLLTPQADQVPRSRIETTLAVWAHRFPDVAEEIAHNYEQGMLMQSMECMAPYYSCMECGQTFQKLPDGAERSNWCSHLGESANAGRILGGVTFTGTGLIFGSRGAKGAYSEAQLDVFQEEIVAAHQETHQESKHKQKTRRQTRMDGIEVPRDEYAALQKRPTPEELAAEKKRADDAEAAKVEADKAVEAAEAAQKKAEEEKAEAEKKLQDAEEEKRTRDLASDRLSKLGKGFKDAMGEKTTQRVTEDAAKLEDDAWEARVEELEEVLGKKRDEGKDETEEEAAARADGTFSKEEITASRVGSPVSGGEGTEPTPEARHAVMGSLLSKPGTDK